MSDFNIKIADKEHHKYAEEIVRHMEESAKARGTGIAKRTPDYVKLKMEEGKAIIALTKKGDFVGFCYIETWGHGKYVANSGLIVVPEFRNSGIARGIKHRAKRSQSLYYAHLDTQMVRVGQKVIPGDTIGLIGNTGNARTTPPHLHFGIYKYGSGSFDPAPFVFQHSIKSLDIVVDADQLGNWMRTSAKTSNLRAAPTTKSTVLKQLAIHTPIRITGSTSDWFRIILPDGSSGYLAASLVETAERPIGQEPTNDRMYIWDAPDPVATPIAHIDKDDMVDILAKFNSFFLVRSSDGIYGWIPETSS